MAILLFLLLLEKMLGPIEKSLLDALQKYEFPDVKKLPKKMIVNRLFGKKAEEITREELNDMKTLSYVSKKYSDGKVLSPNEKKVNIDV